MASTAAKPKGSRMSRRWLVGGGIALALVAICAIAALTLQNFTATAAQTAAAANWTTVAAETGPIDASISATGSVAPQAEANLQFEAQGNVTEILVKEGQQVEAGAPLARIDDGSLQLALAQAQADLKQANADHQKLLDGASPEEIAEAQAQLAQARGQYAQTAGTVTDADIAAARAQLAAAQSKLQRLQAGAQSDTSVQQATSALEQARSQLAATKERARIDVENSANALRNAQDTYSTTYWDNRRQEGELGKFGVELSQEAKDAEAKAKRDMEDADRALQQAQIAYEEAKQQEIATLQAREADVRAAETGSTDSLADARAQVQTAQAELNRLTGQNRSGSLEQARASVAVAEASLAKLQADADTSDLAVAEASIARAEAAVKQAERNLGQATLLAPFSGTITAINVRVGEPASATSAATDGAITMADLSAYHVDVPIDELDVAQLTLGQPVRITLDALPDTTIDGAIGNIAPVATKNDQGTTTYEVTVDLQAAEQRIMPGMTASVAIITSQKDDAVLVPRRAVQTEEGATFVWVPSAGQPDPATGRPASTKRPVTLGLSNNEYVEVTDGLQPGEQVLVAQTTQTLNPFGN